MNAIPCTGHCPSLLLKAAGLAAMLALTACVPSSGNRLTAAEPAPFEDPADFPLMGDWTGRWLNPKGWPDSRYPQLAAQVLPVHDGKYRVVFVTDLYRRAAPLAEFTVKSDGRELRIDADGWNAHFRAGQAVRGKAPRGRNVTEFELTKATWAPPSLGAVPPEGARVLLPASSLDDWEHKKGRAATWTLTNGVMETVGQSWNRGENRKRGLGGDILCKHRFGSLRFHMEFRYPVEPAASGQGRGNSGLFFNPLPELQILNSYTTAGFYDEAGAMYRHLPAKVNAAGPPLAWQTYDVEIRFTGGGSALVTADLNGHRIHHAVEIRTDATSVELMLQDHGNRLQWRNIWVKEL